MSWAHARLANSGRSASAVLSETKRGTDQRRGRVLMPSCEIPLLHTTTLNVLRAFCRHRLQPTEPRRA
jgi:hypothetical protein